MGTATARLMTLWICALAGATLAIRSGRDLVLQIAEALPLGLFVFAIGAGYYHWRRGRDHRFRDAIILQCFILVMIAWGIHR